MTPEVVQLQEAVHGFVDLLPVLGSLAAVPFVAVFGHVLFRFTWKG